MNPDTPEPSPHIPPVLAHVLARLDAETDDTAPAESESSLGLTP